MDDLLNEFGEAIVNQDVPNHSIPINNWGKEGIIENEEANATSCGIKFFLNATYTMINPSSLNVERYIPVSNPYRIPCPPINIEADSEAIK